MKILAFLRLFGRKLSYIWFKAIKTASNPLAHDVCSSENGRSHDKWKESTLNLLLVALRCISNQKINEYWQTSIWLSQLALNDSYIQEIWANAHEMHESL